MLNQLYQFIKYTSSKMSQGIVRVERLSETKNTKLYFLSIITLQRKQP